MPTPRDSQPEWPILTQQKLNESGQPQSADKSLTKTGTQPATVFELIQAHKQEIAEGMPKHLPVDRLIRAFLGEVRRTPKLKQCTATSMYKCFLDMSQIGLEPGPAGLVFLIPYKTEATLQIGYKGMMTLARRSGEISTFSAEVVYAKDKFSYCLGLNPEINHMPYDGDDDPGPMTYAYSVVRMKDGGYQARVLPKREIMRAKEASPAARKSDSPWNGPFEDEMWRKTALKRTCKLCPLSTEVLNAIAIDDAYEANVRRPVDLDVIPNGKKQRFGSEFAKVPVGSRFAEVPAPDANENAQAAVETTSTTVTPPDKADAGAQEKLDA